MAELGLTLRPLDLPSDMLLTAMESKQVIALDKAFFCQPKSIDVFLISSQKHGYSLETPQQGASN